jgi:hypothetical protein
MARPDGSFYVQPLLHSEAFIMALALPDEETGEPIESSLKAFFFRNGRFWDMEFCLGSGTGQNFSGFPVKIRNFQNLFTFFF